MGGTTSSLFSDSVTVHARGVTSWLGQSIFLPVVWLSQALSAWLAWAAMSELSSTHTHGLDNPCACVPSGRTVMRWYSGRIAWRCVVYRGCWAIQGGGRVGPSQEPYHPWGVIYWNTCPSYAKGGVALCFFYNSVARFGHFWPNYLPKIGNPVLQH